MERALRILAAVVVVTSSVAVANPLLAGEPHKHFLDDPNFRPKPEVNHNKTIDQLITDAYGGLKQFMRDNKLGKNGEITAELDMVLTPEQFQHLYMTKKTDAGRYKRKAIRDLVFRWTDNTIPYEFIKSDFTVNEIFYIKAAMNRWQATTCLKFRPFTSGDYNGIRFQNGHGCNSYLGMWGRGVQPINLENPGCRYSGLYLHEVGHAIGLVHEHQLPDRDQYIYILYENVEPSMRIWFEKYSTEEVNQYGVPFEFSSVMTYGVTAFSADGVSQTIEAKNRSREHEIGRVYYKGLSFTDIKVVNLMYQCNKHCAADHSCYNPGYLDKNCKCIRPAECRNVHNDYECNFWEANGECRNFPEFMAQRCAKACKICEPEYDEECRNDHSEMHCEYWANTGECEGNPNWMNKNCAKACGACDTDEEGDCTDDHQYCPEWAAAGFCETDEYTKEHCKKSCNTCD